MVEQPYREKKIKGEKAFCDMSRREEARVGKRKNIITDRCLCLVES